MSLEFFWLLVVDVFFGSSFTEALFAQLDTVLESFSVAKITTSVALAMPGASQFFLYFVLTRTGTWFALQLLRAHAFPALLWRLPRCLSQHAERLAWQPEPSLFGDTIPMAVFMLLLGLCYATVAPVVVLPCAFNFLFCFVIFRYQLLYVHSPQFQTHGHLWLHLVSCCAASLLLAQAVLCSILAVRRAPAAACALAPLAVATLGLYRFHLSSFADTFTAVPRDVAEQADRKHPVLDAKGALPFPFPQARRRRRRDCAQQRTTTTTGALLAAAASAQMYVALVLLRAWLILNASCVAPLLLS